MSGAVYISAADYALPTPSRLRQGFGVPPLPKGEWGNLENIQRIAV